MRAFAQDNGIKIQLEVHGAETQRVPRIRKIFDYAGNPPALRACWNSNQTDLLDGGFDANFQLLKNQIGQIHMRDLMLEEYPWRKLIAGLAEMNFQGYCFAEIPESTDPVRVLKYFRGMFRAYQGSLTPTPTAALKCRASRRPATQLARPLRRPPAHPVQ